MLKILTQMAAQFLPSRSASAAQQGTAHNVDLHNDPDFWRIVRCAMVRTSLQAEQHTLLMANIDCLNSSLAPAYLILC